MLREVRFLSAGRCLVDRSVLVQGDPVGDMFAVPVWTYLLRSDDALLLVDSGMPDTCIDNERYFDGTEDAGFIRPQMHGEDSVERVPARQGLSLLDIDALISTHWHFDHMAIDAVYTRRNWESDVPGAMRDVEVGRTSVARLRELARSEGASVFFGHDPAQAEEPFWRSLEA